ncbi:MAG: arabinose isomerase [Ruminococcaceae bacterium]|nr:arabinose isomerase [Oscillospiraceae bacterium]
MIERKRFPTARVAFFSVVHETYFKQFEGLEESLNGYHKQTADLVAANGVQVFDYGIVGSNQKGYEVADSINGDKIDLIICNMITYATSSVFAPILQNTKAPIVLLALQPLKRMDYSKACTYMQLENDNICSVPEFTGVAIRMGRPVADVILGHLYDDKKAMAELKQWCDIAKVLNGLKGARLGLCGHVLEAMYDMHADPTAISGAFGLHIPLIEIDDIVKEYNKVTNEEIEAKKKVILEEFETPDPKSDPVTRKLTDADLERAAKGSAALDRLVETFSLDGLAYYYEGQENTIQREVATSFIVGNSILNAQGIPMCGEFDIKTCIAMLIMDKLGIGGSFAEFHPFDFEEDFILVGHDGPHHIAIAEGKPILRSLSKFHGKPGSGASVEFKIKEGPITMLGITQTANGKFKFVIGEGTSKAGPIPPTGNTNTRGFFEPTTREFIKKWVMEGPTHHYALGVGHHAETIKKIADVLGLEAVIVK